MCGISTAITVASTLFSAKAASDEGKYQQGVANYNARVKSNEAQQERNVATEAENTQRRETAELIARQRAALGASGVDIGSGSALQIQQDAALLGEADALRIRQTGDDRFNALQEASDLQISQGEAAATAGRNRAFGSLLTGAGKVAGSGVSDKWFTNKSAATADLNNIALGT